MQHGALPPLSTSLHHSQSHDQPWIPPPASNSHEVAPSSAYAAPGGSASYVQQQQYHHPQQQQQQQHGQQQHHAQQQSHQQQPHSLPPIHRHMQQCEPLPSMEWRNAPPPPQQHQQHQHTQQQQHHCDDAAAAAYSHHSQQQSLPSLHHQLPPPEHSHQPAEAIPPPPASSSAASSPNRGQETDDPAYAYEPIAYTDASAIQAPSSSPIPPPLSRSPGGHHHLHEPGTGLRLRPHSTPATLCWLEKNYELAEGVCIPRNVVYFNYVDFCSKNHMQPVNAASFGKIIRQMFANLTTRRLGTRGQSRYHYYGLAVKPDSIYYSPNYSSRKADHQIEQKFYPKPHMVRPGPPSPSGYTVASDVSTCASGGPSAGGQSSGGTGVYSSGFASAQHLPEFPSFREFDQASTIPADKLQTLLTMYRVHCQRIMDSVNKFSFSEIPHLFTHFWQEIPPHIADLLGQNIVVTLIGVCDAILYRTILKAILPTAIQMFPENVLKIIRKFADDVVGSLQYSLKQVPENLIYVKMKLVRQMSKMLKRRTSVNHLYQTACLVINPSNHSVYDTMAADWSRVDVKRTLDECGSKACNAEEIKAISDTFQHMLDQRSTMAQFCLWINGVVDAYTKMDSESIHLISKIRRFLVIWTSMTAKLLKQLKQTKTATSTSAFQLLQLMLNEYILHEIERLVCEDSMSELMLNMVNAQATELSDSSFIDSLGPDFLSSPNLFQNQVAAEASSPRATASAPSSTLTESNAVSSAKRIKLEKIHVGDTANQHPSDRDSYWHVPPAAAAESGAPPVTYGDSGVTYAITTAAGTRP